MWLQHQSASIPAGDALAMIERCQGHTPTLEEAYSVKARVLKHAGDPAGAAASADKARFMDLADRCDSVMQSLTQRLFLSYRPGP